jgi:outer membrane lipoprotein-sorting protein
MTTHRLLLLCLVSLTLAPPGVAQRAKRKTAPKAQLTGAQIMDRYVAATGGSAAYAKITSTASRGTLTLRSAGRNIEGVVEVYAQAPNRMYQKTSLAGIGDTIQVCNGQAGWIIEPNTPARFLTGAELAELRRQAMFQAPARWRELYEKAELLGQQKMQNQPVYVVRLRSKNSQAVTHYFDAKSFLLRRIDSVSVGPRRVSTVESYYSDYRPVNGIKTPFGMRQILGGTTEVQLTFTEIKNNVPIDAALFQPPAEKTP